ncbi:ATP-binding protein [Phenylobacterium sp.]|uniref:AAA family ATPase n=1 Tax=Phenylobacterium sp. TaxID=1871053 RepID=UPI002898FB78|nr:ATP-binding protein [Phenylobacterium sp.]
MAVTLADALVSLRPLPGLAVLMCGIAGSGKTTFAMELERAGFSRLSIDEEIWRRHGRYGLDYPPEAYPGHVEAARAAIRARLHDELQEGHAVVVDSSFWSRSHREDFKAAVAAAGGTWRLIYLKADVDVLRLRLSARTARFDANAALPIDDRKLAEFVRSFEPPVGEGETVVRVA